MSIINTVTKSEKEAENLYWKSLVFEEIGMDFYIYAGRKHG